MKDYQSKFVPHILQWWVSNLAPIHYELCLVQKFIEFIIQRWPLCERAALSLRMAGDIVCHLDALQSVPKTYFFLLLKIWCLTPAGCMQAVCYTKLSKISDGKGRYCEFNQPNLRITRTWVSQRKRNKGQPEERWRRAEDKEHSRWVCHLINGRQCWDREGWKTWVNGTFFKRIVRSKSVKSYRLVWAQCGN